jgi:hypothetical protein
LIGIEVVADENLIPRFAIEIGDNQSEPGADILRSSCKRSNQHSAAAIILANAIGARGVLQR